MLAGDLYLEHFGLALRPFSLLPDPDFLHWGSGHSSAFAVLEYGLVSRAPITVLTGEVGVGKTTLVRKLLEHFDDGATVGLVSNTYGGRAEILRWVMNAIELVPEPGADYVANYQALQDFLVEEYASGRHVAVIIDEAQNLSFDALEELRMLTNINSGKDELLQLVLVGQPELRSKIQRPDLQQFAQRIAAAYHLSPLSVRATHAYVQHRIAHAGGRAEIFAPAALDAIAHNSGGIPRLINKLSEFCLVYGAIDGIEQITEATVADVIRDGIFVTGFLEGGKAAE